MSIKLKLHDSEADPLRLSYNALHEAEDYRGDGKFCYRAKVLLKKGGANAKMVQDAVIAEAKAMWGDNFLQMLAQFKGNKQKMCISDGDLEADDGHEGSIVLAAKKKASGGRIDIRDRNKAPLTEADGKPYSGCYINVIVDIWAQDGANKGVRCGLLAVQFVRDGDAFSGGSSVSEDDFEDLTAGANVTHLPRGEMNGTVPSANLF